MVALTSVPLLVCRIACGVAASFVAASTVAAAPDVICSPFVPHTRSVGNTATDASCTDDTIQSAIDNTVCPNTTIFVTRERTYTAQHLTIQDKSLTLSGSSLSCGVGGTRPDSMPEATPTAPVVTLDGSGNGGQSVLVVRGTSNVTVQFLELTHGGGGSGSHGGGIDFQGAGSLVIDTSTIDSNTANFGGGVEFSGVGGSAALTLNAYTIIESNHASGNGGGINLEGIATLSATAPFTFIGFNSAVNRGGGVAVVGPAHASLASPGYDALPFINGNNAAFGGGISVQALDSSDGSADVFTVDALHPVTLSGNFASQQGGAIYMKPQSGGDSANANVCVNEARIDGNSAPEGAAIFLDNDPLFSGGVGSSIFRFNGGFCTDPAPIIALKCASGVVCNTLDDNRAVDGTNNPTPGSVLLTNGDSQAFMFRFAMRNNLAAHALHLLNDTHSFGKCLIADNALAEETISYDDAGHFAFSEITHIDSCTIVNNLHNSGSVIHAERDLSLTHSIVDQPAMSTLSTGGTPSITAQFVLAADPTGLPLQEDVVRGEPTYADAGNVDVKQRNYRQTAYVQAGTVTSSFGMDFAPLVAGDDRDLDGNPYDQDVPQVPDHLGIRDLGCYEAQPILDRVFGDAFGDALTLVF